MIGHSASVSQNRKDRSKIKRRVNSGPPGSVCTSSEHANNVDVVGAEVRAARGRRDPDWLDDLPHGDGLWHRVEAGLPIVTRDDAPLRERGITLRSASDWIKEQAVAPRDVVWLNVISQWDPVDDFHFHGGSTGSNPVGIGRLAALPSRRENPLIFLTNPIRLLQGSTRWGV